MMEDLLFSCYIPVNKTYWYLIPAKIKASSLNEVVEIAKAYVHNKTRPAYLIAPGLRGTLRVFRDSHINNLYPSYQD